MRRIAVARFAHEGNSFASIPTVYEDFTNFEWATGQEVVPFYQGTNTEIGGVIAELAEHPDWQPHYLRCAFATPAGEIERDAFERILEEILDGLRNESWDAVFLAQHGAMQVEGIDHADRVIIERVRAVIGDIPLGACYDLHANISAAQLDLLDIAIGYKCHPHTDMAATAAKGVRQLLRYAETGRRPIYALRALPSFIPSINARTTDGPMAEAAAFARGLSEHPELIDVTIYQGYAYGDRAHAGGCVLVYAEPESQALAEHAAELTLAETMRIYPRLFVSMPDAQGGVAQALELIDRGRKPVAVIDTADHPGAGTNADTPGMLRAVLEQAQGRNVVFAYLWDPESIAKAAEAGIGATVELSLGARLTQSFGPPVQVSARIEMITDGKIVHVGPFQNGLTYDYGRTCMLAVGTVRIILIERCLTVSDPAFFAKHGIDLASLDLLAIKAKNQFRAAFSDSFAALIDIDEPGPAAYDFSRLPFKLVPPERRIMPKRTSP